MSRLVNYLNTIYSSMSKVLREVCKKLRNLDMVDAELIAELIAELVAELTAELIAELIAES